MTAWAWRADSTSRWMTEITGDGKVWVPRNTIVRAVVNEVLHCSDGISLAMLADCIPPGDKHPTATATDKPSTALAASHLSPTKAALDMVCHGKENSRPVASDAQEGEMCAAVAQAPLVEGNSHRLLGQRRVFRIPM
jgi:hypothetical protein